MKYLLAIICIVTVANSQPCLAQCKTFKISSKGDTLNCIDQQNKRQGKWINRYAEVRGEPGFEEEGEYNNNLKEGKWRLYSLEGDLIGIENYKWGLKDGKQIYFVQGAKEHEESWRAPNPDNDYDTIQVPDVNDPDKYEMKIIKVEHYAQKHGVWIWYRLGTESIIKTETYLFNELQVPVNENKSSQSEAAKPKKIEKPKEVLEFEKKNKGKKKVKYKDGSIGY